MGKKVFIFSPWSKNTGNTKITNKSYQLLELNSNYSWQLSRDNSDKNAVKFEYFKIVFSK